MTGLQTANPREGGAAVNLPAPKWVHLGRGTTIAVTVEQAGSQLVVRLARFEGHHGTPPTALLELRGAHAIEIGALMQRAGQAAESGPR